MELYLNEYNATPIKEERDSFTISIKENIININNNIIENEDIINNIEAMLNTYKTELLECKNKQYQNIKGGRQATLQIFLNTISDDVILITGNTDNNEISTLYYEIKEELIKLLEP